ncbi:MAG: UDP-N-acetylglucosamine 2-epimerase (hydrolyzing) [Psychroserpens sp.]
MTKKKIVFLTGTRADFGKLKSLIHITQKSIDFDVYVFATGMHMNSKYGKTVDEIFKSNIRNIYQYINHDGVEHMDRTLAKTIDGFSHYIAEINPDMIIVHGDRVEALAGAIVGSLNNILVSHIEGGEISGTIDELIRHAVSKMSHIHFVANDEAKNRLIQLGEKRNSVFVIGSPDLDLMNPKSLPCISTVKKYYDIDYVNYSIAMFHPVTTEYESIREYSKAFIDALVRSGENYILIYPNNDLGSNEILSEFKRVSDVSNIKIFPSLRFEYFLTLLKDAEFIIGNSSAGVREAPYYSVPTIDIGSRQKNRVSLSSIINCKCDTQSILNAIKVIKEYKRTPLDFRDKSFGNGNSDKLFYELLCKDSLWEIEHQKQFQEI